jgi:hypothetical protein
LYLTKASWYYKKVLIELVDISKIVKVKSEIYG